MASDHVDVLIIGAGLSGIGAACHLRRDCPDKTYAVLEARDAVGGTWDLFRYPGVRSDSDMFTLGYSFRPWTDPQAIADGAAIRAYVQETAREYDVQRHIRFSHRVLRAEWDSDTARWTVHAQRTDTAESVVADLLVPLRLHRLLPLRRGLHTRAAGRRRVRRAAGAPAALARRPRPHRQAGGGHRQRRDRCHPGAGHGPAGRPRDDAPALTHVRHRAALARPAGRRAAALAAGGGRVSGGALEERAAVHGQLPAQPARAAAGQAAAASGRATPTTGRVRRRQALLAPLRPVGPAALRGARRRPVHRRAAGRGVGGDRHHRHVHRARRPAGLRRRAARRHRGHRDRAQPARPRRPDAARRRRRGRPARHRRLQGHDALRRAELRADHRLHQRVVDAQGRPGRRLRLPAAAPPGPHRSAGRHPARHRPAHSGCRLSTCAPPTCCAASTRCPNRVRRRRGGCTRTTPATCC